MYNTLLTKTFLDDFFYPRSLGVADFTYLNSRIVAKQDGDTLEIAVSVPGHDPKSVKVDLTETHIHIKTEKEVDGIEKSFATPIEETLKLSKDFDGLTAKAKLENGVLKITVDKKAETKQKKLSISF